MSITTHPKSLDEILTQANTSTNIAEYLKGAMSYPFVRQYIDLATNEHWTTLDTDKVEFKNYQYHQSMCGALLLNSRTWSIVSQVLMNPKASIHTQTVQFKGLSEMLDQKEAEVLKSILKKDLTTLYPNLTHELLCEVLDGTL